MSAELKSIKKRKEKREKRKAIGIALFFVLFSFPLHSEKRTVFDLPHTYKDCTFQFFPIPYFETDPAAGQRYGLMPTFLWYDPKDHLITIGVASLTYNKVVGIGGFAGLFLYPSAKESMTLFFGASQRYERDYYFQYSNETWLEEKLDAEVELEYIQNPFERFFGFGAASSETNESNFVSHLWYWKGRTAYEIFPHLDLELEEKWMRMSMHPRALTSLNDTAVFFAGNQEVGDSNQWLHRFSVAYDTRPDGRFSKKGERLSAYLQLGHHTFDGDNVYSGYGFLAKKIFTLQERFTTVLRLMEDQLFGDRIPFYMQPMLGGQDDLRAFVDRRFTGRGRLLLDAEERILVKSLKIMNAKFDLSIDPFFSVGQVFDHWNEVQWNHLQPVGGIGFRGVVPPSVLGRVDIGVGGEGLQVYTTLNYPF